jgi:biopolymer transport protein ExbB
MYFRKIKVDEETMISRLKATLEKGHYDEALSICEANPSPVTNLMKVGIEHRDLPLDMIKNMVTDAANMEIPKMERYLSSLGTISSIAPLLASWGRCWGIYPPSVSLMLRALQGQILLPWPGGSPEP